MARLPLAPILALLGAGCAEVESLSASAIAQRRAMNDLQARATLAASCDIALGSYFRELNEAERRFVALICGGIGVEEGEVAGAPPTLDGRLFSEDALRPPRIAITP